MKIKQVEELVGITRKNIRFYEEQGLLQVARADNGYREYHMQDVRRLQQIRLLRKLSVPLEDIRALFAGTLRWNLWMRSSVWNGWSIWKRREPVLWISTKPMYKRSEETVPCLARRL